MSGPNRSAKENAQRGRLLETYHVSVERPSEKVSP